MTNHKKINKKYEIGDIVFVSKGIHTEKNIDNHLFVIINEEKNELIPIEFFGMIVSSRLEKSKEKSKYKYNEPLDKNKKMD